MAPKDGGKDGGKSMGKSMGKSIDRSTAWSEYIWDESGQFWWSSRTGPSGEVEYDYRYPETEETHQQRLEIPRSPGPNVITGDDPSYFVTTPDYPQASYQPGNEFTSFENDSSVANPTGSNTNLPAANYKGSNQGNTGSGYQLATTRYYIPTSGGSEAPPGRFKPYTFSKNDTLTASFSDLTFSPPTATQAVQPGGVAVAKVIKSPSKSGTFEKLDPRYRVVPDKDQRNFWKVGRVFMMLWTEAAQKVPPSGGTRDGSHFSTVWLSEGEYSEVRKFVVIREGHGNSICSPIHTYSSQATLKLNVPERQQHAIIYTSKSVPEEYSYKAVDGKIISEALSRDPIKVSREQSGPEGDLGSLSRINYSKIYTVENYVRVLNIGMVTKESLPALTYNSFPNLSPFNLSLSEPPSNPKSRGATADRRIKDYKLSSHRAKAPGSRAQSMNSYVQSSVYDPEVSASIDLSESSDRLDDGYEIIKEPSRFFKKGRVIKVLWTEPAGNISESDDSFVIPSRFGEKAFAKIRRFVVVREMQDCCWCLMLNTHHSKGASKAGVNPDNYAAVYPLGGWVQLGPDEYLTKNPFPIKVEVPGESISPKSRLNFGRVYTLEHNIRVKKVGRIPDEYHQQLDDYFSQISAGK